MEVTGLSEQAPIANARAGRVQSPRSRAALELENADTGADALFRPWLVAQDDLDERDHVRSDLLGIGLNCRGGHTGIMAVLGGHVRHHRRLASILGTRAPMAGNTFAALKRLDGAGRDPHPKSRPREVVGDGVVMVIDADVVIGSDGNSLPIGMGMACRGQRDQCGFVQPFKKLQARRAKVTADAAIQAHQFFADGRVQLLQREEDPIAQPRNDPVLNQQHSAFRLRFILWFVRTGREDGRLILAREIGVAAVDTRFMKTCPDQGRFEIVRHDQGRCAAEELERADMRADPVRQCLASA